MPLNSQSQIVSKFLTPPHKLQSHRYTCTYLLELIRHQHDQDGTHLVEEIQEQCKAGLCDIHQKVTKLSVRSNVSRNLRFDAVLYSFFHSFQVSSHTLSRIKLWNSILVGLEQMHAIVYGQTKARM